jgi:hypothetical protein
LRQGDDLGEYQGQEKHGGCSTEEVSLAQ